VNVGARRVFLTVVAAILGVLAFASAQALAAAPEAPGPVTVEGVNGSGATVNGVLYPHAVAPGEAGSYEFLYRKGKAGCEAEGKGSAGLAMGTEAEKVSEALSGLEPDTEYSVCLRIETPGGATVGPVATFTTLIPPEVPEATKASPIAAESATLNGVLNPKAAGEAGTYEFLYKASESNECEGEGQVAVPVPAADAAGKQAEAVSMAIAGLSPHTQYTFCVKAYNKVGEPAVSAPVTFRTLAKAAVIEEESVTDVASTSATFHATVNPGGADTTYRFEDASETGAFEPVRGPKGESFMGAEGDVGGGIAGVPVEVHVQGLAASASYRFRVVAVSTPVSSLETVVGEVQSFITQRAGGASGLPDGRQWELVTPPDKRGALFFGYGNGRGQYLEEGGSIQASVNGGAIVDLASEPSEAEPQGFGENVSVLSTRGGGGWSSQVIAPSHKSPVGVSVGYGEEYRLFSEDLSHGLLQPFGGFTALSPEATESTPYIRTDYLNGNVSEHCTSSCYQPLVTAGNAPGGIKFGNELDGHCEIIAYCGPVFDAATPDFRHIILNIPLFGGSEYSGSLYEWSGGQLQLIGAMKPAGISSEGGEGANLTEQLGAGRAMSSNGERVILSNGSNHGDFRSSPLYLWDSTSEKTIRLDEPENPSGTGGVEYATANTEASRIFFIGGGHLTTVSSASGRDLYDYDLDAPQGARLTDLSVDPSGAAEVREVLGVSEDGSYVYFTAAGAFAQGAQSSDCSPYENEQNLGEEDGKNAEALTCNVYVYHDGVTRLVAAAGPWPHSARVSPNGQWLEFMSDRDLTGYDTRDVVSGHLDAEVYLYDASTNRLVCASCDPTGARPVGFENIPHQEGYIGIFATDRNKWVAATVPDWEQSQAYHGYDYQARYLSDSGRLFFDSYGALVPDDVNGTWDVYEYEPAGVGSCSVGSVTFGGSADGCVGLISSGSSPEESAFLDASGTGGDVFFITLAKLVAQDYDDAFDVYDAHECSASSPCVPAVPVSPPPCATGDACKAAPTPQPAIFGAAPSATFSGPGNLTPGASSPVAKPRSLTRAQKLARALRACRGKPRKQRGVCERNARKRYGESLSRKSVLKRGRKG
jgi:hypothetical protein